LTIDVNYHTIILFYYKLFLFIKSPPKNNFPNFPQKKIEEDVRQVKCWLRVDHLKDVNLKTKLSNLAKQTVQVTEAANAVADAQEQQNQAEAIQVYENDQNCPNLLFYNHAAPRPHQDISTITTTTTDSTKHVDDNSSGKEQSDGDSSSSSQINLENQQSDLIQRITQEFERRLGRVERRTTRFAKVQFENCIKSDEFVEERPWVNKPIEISNDDWKDFYLSVFKTPNGKWKVLSVDGEKSSASYHSSFGKKLFENAQMSRDNRSY